ncbi:phosphoribosylformylglycinamidine synthase, partial [Coemansia sp. Cherry 401B]
ASQATIQRVSDDQDPDSEKHELADKERELWVLSQRGTIRLWLSKAADTFGLCELGDVHEVSIRESDGSDELARPIRNIEAAQAQGGAKQNEGTPINLLAQTNHELGLTLAADEIAYLVDAYLGAQAADSRIACNLMDAELMIFVQVNSGHCRYNLCFRGRLAAVH